MRKWLPVGTLMLVALLAALPLWGAGLVNTRGGGDSPFLLQRLHQVTVSLRAGVFPVRWMPDAAYGLGYPFFSYYAALPYYLAGLSVLAGLDFLTALKVVQTLGFLGAAIAMYGWLYRTTARRWAAWLGGVAYTVAPFHLVNVYVRGDSLSEFYAFVFYPLILWALDRGLEGEVTPGRARRAAQWAWLALAYAGLVLTHNISAFIFTPFVVLYLAMLSLRGGANQGPRASGWASPWRGLLALGMGLLLAAWFWVPALAESDVVQLGTVTSGYFHYTNHFRTTDLVQHQMLFDYAIRPEGGTPFAMGLPQAALALLGTMTLVVRLLRRPQARWGFILLGLLASTVMITPLSKPLWDHLPLLPMVQFPWRFLSVQALFAAAATAALVPVQPPARGTCGVLPIAWVSIAVLLVASALRPLHPERLPISPAEVTTERLQLYELFTGNIGTTIRHEYLYQAAVPRPFTSDALIEPEAPPRAIPLDGARLQALLLRREPTRQEWRVWGEGGGLAFPLLYWPGWQATIDDQPAAVAPVEGSGYLSVQVGTGDHTVILWLGRTPGRAVAESLSLAAWLGLAVLGLRRMGRRPRLSLLLGALTAVGVVARLAAVSSPPAHTDASRDLTMDFIQMPYLHRNPGGVAFEGGGRLAWYELSADTLAPGDTLSVTMLLDLPPLYTARLSMVSPAAVRYEVEPLAEGECKASSCTLTVPEDAARGLYLLRLRVFGPEGEVHALTRLGAQQGMLYLSPVRIPDGPSRAPDTGVVAFFGPDIWLHQTTITQPASDRLAVRLVWSAARPLAANYGVSLRLHDRQGRVVAQLDTQPGYGFLPTSLWRPGELVTDPYLLVLPWPLEPDEGYHLEVVLYQVSSLEEIGRARLGDFALPLAGPCVVQPLPRQFALPRLDHPLAVDFAGEIRLAGYDLERSGETLQLTLWWQALQTPKADYTVFVHLFDSPTAPPLTQSDAPPRGGAYPTSLWSSGEVVSQTVTLPLRGLPEGTYRLGVGLYDRDLVRLPAVGPNRQPIPDNRAVLPALVTIR